jgi:hypothetical protein
MTRQNKKQISDNPVTYHEMQAPSLEPVPAKSPHRKYLVLVALHMVHSDDPEMLCEAADCSERTLHYVKNRLRDQDGVVFNHDRNAKRYFVIETGVLDLPKVVEMMRKLYPNRFAYIQDLREKSGAPDEQQLWSADDSEFNIAG